MGGPSIDELRRSCDGVLFRGKRLTLDLSEVSFIDHDGVALLRSLKSTNVQLENCSPFVALRLEEGGVK